VITPAIPFTLSEAILTEIPEIEGMARVRRPYNGLIVRPEKRGVYEEKNIGYIDDAWLELFTYEVKEGTWQIIQRILVFSLIFYYL